MAFYTGKTGTVSIATASQPLTDWSADFKSESIDVTNFSSSGYQENYAGISSADITASGPYDGSMGAQVGDSAAFVLTAGSGGISYSVTARITSVKIDVNVRGVAICTLTATSNGSYSVSV